MQVLILSLLVELKQWLMPNNTIELKNALFMHDTDAQGNVEISYNI